MASLRGILHLNRSASSSFLVDPATRVCRSCAATSIGFLALLTTILHKDCETSVGCCERVATTGPYTTGADRTRAGSCILWVCFGKLSSTCIFRCCFTARLSCFLSRCSLALRFKRLFYVFVSRVASVDTTITCL